MTKVDCESKRRGMESNAAKGVRQTFDEVAKNKAEGGADGEAVEQGFEDVTEVLDQ
jgi:hypothetical protein